VSWILPGDSLFVDTSAWVEYFRGPSRELGEAIDFALEEGRAVGAGVILMELLQGARDEPSLKKIEELFDTLPLLDVGRMTWKAAGRLSNRYKKKGIVLPLPDVLVAQLCIENTAFLLTTDRHFERIREVHLYHGKVFSSSRKN
jgi:predicted nucleic acid-binding protein